MGRLEAYLEKLSTYNTTILHELDFATLQANILKHGGEYIGSRGGWLGTSKVTTKEKERFLKDRGIQTQEGILTTPTERGKIALLKTIEEEKKKWKWKKEILEMSKTTQPPLFCIPTEGYLIYGDIKACYFYITKYFLYSEYAPDRYIARKPYNTQHLEKLADDKEARLSMYGLMITTRAVIYNKRIVKAVTIKNELLNPTLRVITHELLNSLAWRFKQLGAIYGYIDGFIFTSEQQFREAQEIAESVGLCLRKKYEGYGEVKALGAYKIGEKQSLIYEKAKTREHEKIITISNPLWVIEQISKIIKR